MSKISARIHKKESERICQGDIFKDIEIIEDIDIQGSKIIISKLYFPFVICLNQECDLDVDFKQKEYPKKDSSLLHLAIAPVFNFEHFKSGDHWDNIFKDSQPLKNGTKYDLIIDNEIPRYHYLKFKEEALPDLIIDFKHFFSISRNALYSQITKRLCSIDDLFKEKISQRFSYYISRIGLPEIIE